MENEYANMRKKVISDNLVDEKEHIIAWSKEGEGKYGNYVLLGIDEDEYMFANEGTVVYQQLQKIKNIKGSISAINGLKFEMHKGKTINERTFYYMVLADGEKVKYELYEYDPIVKGYILARI
ncbi:MAG: hypothetical protein QXU98_11890 [Candidatus Parvarchaeota archaeon]